MPAEFGGSDSRTFFISAAALAPSTSGGKRIDSLSAVKGRCTFPAERNGGRPSAPVTASAARQVRLSTSSTGSLVTGWAKRPALASEQQAAHGKRFQME